MHNALFSQINWLAVLAGTAAYFILGAIWFGPLFSKRWIAYHRININDPNMKGGMAAIMTTSFVLMFLAAFGQAILVESLDLSGVSSGIRLGLLTGLCFSASAISITYLYLKKPLGLHLIDGFYHVAGQILSAIILCIWR